MSKCHGFEKKGKSTVKTCYNTVLWSFQSVVLIMSSTDLHCCSKAQRTLYLMLYLMIPFCKSYLYKYKSNPPPTFQPSLIYCNWVCPLTYICTKLSTKLSCEQTGFQMTLEISPSSTWHLLCLLYFIFSPFSLATAMDAILLCLKGREGDLRCITSGLPLLTVRKLLDFH